MKIIFAGTPLFAAEALDALFAAGHEIALVLTQPDKAAGRGLKTVSSPVKMLAQKYGLPLLQPASLKNQPEIEAHLAALNADVMIVAAYGLILPKSILDIPRLGCVNIHASLLPRWRGAAPIQRAILSGDDSTGITLMQMDSGLDTGDMLYREAIPIAEDDTSQTLHDKLAALGAECIVRLLAVNPEQRYPGTRQDEAQACYAAKLSKSEARIDWHASAELVERMIRGYNPFPGATCLFDDTPVKIWQARLARGVTGVPGEVVAVGKDGILIACGQDGLSLEMLQKPGAKKLSATQFLSGYPVQNGTLLR